MGLNVDCLMHVLRRCSEEAVVNVSRASKDANALINRRIGTLPQLHKFLMVTIDMDEKLVRCRPLNLRHQLHQWNDGFSRDETLARCWPLSLRHPSFKDLSTSIRWNDGLRLNYFLDHYRYFAIDNIVIFSTGDRYDQQLMEEFFKDVEPLGVQNTALLYRWNRFFVMSVVGPTPSNLQQIMKSAEGGFSCSSKIPLGKKMVDYSFLLDALLDGNNTVTVNLKDCSPSHVALFVEKLLQASSASKARLARFDLRFDDLSGTTGAEFASVLIPKILPFASIESLTRYCIRTDDLVLKGSGLKIKLYYLGLGSVGAHFWMFHNCLNQVVCTSKAYELLWTLP